jgi:hypothetical protein
VRVDHRTLEARRKDARNRGDKFAEVSLLREPEMHIGQRRPGWFLRMPSLRPEFKLPDSRPKRNAAILDRNAAQARARLEKWQKAYVRQLHRAA